jgi:hypothetical protein
LHNTEMPGDEEPRAGNSPPHGVETEYRVVRDEILLRINLRQQIIAVTLTLGGAFLGVGIKQPAVALVCPPLAAFLALAWAQNDYRVRDIALYIRTCIEPALPALGWESYISKRRSGGRLNSWRFVVTSHGGLFLFTQAAAVFVGVVGVLGNIGTQSDTFRLVAVTLTGLDLCAIVAVIYLVMRASRK